MALLPSGFALPSLPYLLALLLLVGAAAVALYVTRPEVTQAAVVAFAPWMVTGAVGYALFQVGVFPPVVAPLFGSPAVYLTTFGLAGLVWAAGTRYDFLGPVLLSSVGGVAMVGGLLFALAVGVTRGTLALTWPVVSLVVGTALAGGAWAVARRLSVSVGDTGLVGMLVVFGHALDGVSTAVGADVPTITVGEQSPLSRVILDVGAALPTADLLGTGWLFVVVKLALALLVVHLLGDLVREEPRTGYATLGVVAAVGLGPGAHNVVLFAIIG